MFLFYLVIIVCIIVNYIINIKCIVLNYEMQLVNGEFYYEGQCVKYMFLIRLLDLGDLYYFGISIEKFNNKREKFDCIMNQLKRVL